MLRNLCVSLSRLLWECLIYRNACTQWQLLNAWVWVFLGEQWRINASKTCMMFSSKDIWIFGEDFLKGTSNSIVLYANASKNLFIVICFRTGWWEISHGLLGKDAVEVLMLFAKVCKEFHWSSYIFAAGAWLSLSAHSSEGFFKQSSKECLKFFFVNSCVSNAFAR